MFFGKPLYLYWIHNGGRSIGTYRVCIAEENTCMYWIGNIFLQQAELVQLCTCAIETRFLPLHSGLHDDSYRAAATFLLGIRGCSHLPFFPLVFSAEEPGAAASVAVESGYIDKGKVGLVPPLTPHLTPRNGLYHDLTLQKFVRENFLKCVMAGWSSPKYFHFILFF